MEITFLGTSSMLPTKDRNPSAILISNNAENILVDCGEGTQRQMRIKGISPTKITKILITHWHGDHVLGLPGLLQTLGSNQYQKTLDIYGPKGTKEFFNNLLKSFIFPFKINVNLHEVSKGIISKDKDLEIETIEVEHSTKCQAYSIKQVDKRKININYTKKFGLTQHPLLGNLQQGKDITYNGKKILASKATTIKKGKKITIILDTMYCKNAVELAKNSDVLISEATFKEEMQEKGKEYKHLTSVDAAKLAKESKSNELILTHFSQRYNDVKELEREAKRIFKKTKTSEDFMTFSVDN
jgi:ribonuclease Z